MLTHISISNYTIASELEVEFSSGMTVITGETGAGKSIMLDALGLCLGDRADPKAVRRGCERAEIHATFDIADNARAQQWLKGRDLELQEDAAPECLLRRVVTAEGRSRAYINGSVATLNDCAELGALLIDVHGQHAHQSLLRKSAQRTLLDGYAQQGALVRKVETIASDWLRCKRELALLSGGSDERGARAQLLAYQVEELDTLALGEGELAPMEAELAQLSNAETILHQAHQALEHCEQHAEGAASALQLLKDEHHCSQHAVTTRELLDSAAIALTEARSELQHHIDSVELNPERLNLVQQRLDAIYDIARKHRVMPEQLCDRHTQLRDELQALNDGDERITELETDMASLQKAYLNEAAKLSKQRKTAAKKLVKAAQQILGTLAMEQCQLEVALQAHDDETPNPNGAEDIEFLLSTNPGAAKQPLGKVASGGELSRISLAIAVVTASAATVPSMVFDEVDVGIGGAVAEVVGKLLRDMANTAQVLCVTHLPQVAAQGQQHLRVSKSSDKRSAETSLKALQENEKIEEIARMLGGVTITQQTLAHAEEMLAGAH